MLKYVYIVLEFKGEIGYLLYKDSFMNNMNINEFNFIENVENIYQNMVSIIAHNHIDKIADKLTILQLNPILEYKIMPIGSFLSGLGATTYYPILNFELILIETDNVIVDFSKLKRSIYEPSIDIGVIKILDEKDNDEELGFDLYLN